MGYFIVNKNNIIVKMAGVNIDMVVLQAQRLNKSSPDNAPHRVMG